MVIDQVNNAVSTKLASSIEWLQEKFTGKIIQMAHSFKIFKENFEKLFY